MDWKFVLGVVLIVGALFFLIKKGSCCCGTKSDKKNDKPDQGHGSCCR